MSYKVDLTDLKRDEGTLTATLAQRIAADIESGVLAPGAKLPTTRALAADASINHLTAARVYRRLAEQGYVAAHVGRGTFVRAHPRVEGGADDDDWQLGALPSRPGSYGRAATPSRYSLRRFEACSCKPTPRGPPSSLVKHRDRLRDRVRSTQPLRT